MQYVCFAVVMCYVLVVGFKYWCIDCPKDGRVLPKHVAINELYCYA
jgi:hypothetical protein